MQKSNDAILTALEQERVGLPATKALRGSGVSRQCQKIGHRKRDEGYTVYSNRFSSGPDRELLTFECPVCEITQTSIVEAK